MTSFSLAWMWVHTSMAATAKHCLGPMASNRIRSMAEVEPTDIV